MARDSIVGWSKRSIYGNSVPNSILSAFANYVAATESNPAAISGELEGISVPRTFRRHAETILE